MAELDRQYRGSFSREMPGGDRKIQDEYFKVKSQYDELRNQQINSMNKRVAINRKQTNAQQSSKVFVNSYDEATTRYITSGTYERAQKRLNKQVSNWLSK